MTAHKKERSEAMHKHQLLVVVVALLVVGGTAAAGQISWIFQDTGCSQGSGSVALGMRGDHTWPVIFSDDNALVLLPTGWQNSNGGSVGPIPRAISSLTGEVAAWDCGTGVVSGPNGWESITADAMAFDNQGRLWKAVGGVISRRDNGAWHPLPSLGGVFSQPPSIAVAGNGDVGAVTLNGEQMYYHQYSPLTGGWTTSENLNVDGEPHINLDPMLTFDSRDIPHIVGIDGNMGVVFDCNARAKWVSSLLPHANDVWGVLPIASSGKVDEEDTVDTVGTAYVSNGKLYYASNKNNGDWTAVELPTDGSNPPDSGPAPYEGRGVGLAYDYNGFPIIAYCGDSHVWMAYDPPAVPEPVTMTLLALGSIALLRKRRC